MDTQPSIKTTDCTVARLRPRGEQARPRRGASSAAALLGGLHRLARVLATPFSEALAARRYRRSRRRKAVVARPPAFPLGTRGVRSAEPGLGDQLFSMLPLVFSLGVVGSLLGLYGAAAPKLFRGPTSLPAPTLTERTLDEAIEAARLQGVAVAVADRKPTENLPKNMVIAQEPPPGSHLKRDEPVKLTLSAGLLPPSVVGKTLEQARIALIVAGWSAVPQVETRPTGGSGPNLVVDQRPKPDEAVEQKGPVTLVVGITNLAHGKTVRTSLGGLAPEAVDGQPATVAWVPGVVAGWIEIDLGGPSTVGAISLQLAQEQPGPATIELWAWDVNNRFFPIHAFTQDTADNLTLTARLAQPAANLTRLRVATTTAPSPIGWREITILQP